MTPQQFNEIYRILKSVPAGKRKKAKEKVHLTKRKQPMVVKAEQKKKIYLPHPAGQNAEHVRPLSLTEL